MKKKFNNKAVMAALALAVGVAQTNAAISSTFDLNELNNNTNLLAHGAEGACGEGKCGADKKADKKAAEAKCGEGKCGADKKAAAKKAAEAKCGAEKKAGEGTCGAKKE